MGAVALFLDLLVSIDCFICHNNLLQSASATRDYRPPRSLSLVGSGGSQSTLECDAGFNPSFASHRIAAGQGDFSILLNVGPSVVLPRPFRSQPHVGVRGEWWFSRTSPPAVVPDIAASGRVLWRRFGCQGG